ncbi:DUF6192 family protein [Streptomyces sp. NPDC088137]|uniref:DUF6192 family protein n=1 Tax=Streptomyces sp. NPDC088137 TaxID=3365827 RepID=UPI0038073DEA
MRPPSAACRRRGSWPASSRWPAVHRQTGVSPTVHRILAHIEVDEERCAAILILPEGRTRSTADDAKRRVGNRVETPVTPQEKVTAIHSLAQDDRVAAAVTREERRHCPFPGQPCPERAVPASTRALRRH